MKVYILLVCALLSATNAYTYTEAIYIHSKKYGLDPALVKTIVTLESGLNPLAINVAGKAYFPKSKHAAASIIQQAWATEKSFDVGLMQINSWWMRRYGLDPVELLDVDSNLALGTKILSLAIQQHGNTWQAVGAYHSPTKNRGQAYAWKVYTQLHNIANKGTPSYEIKQKKSDDKNLPFREGLWRNPAIQRNGRIITFGIRKKNVFRNTH